MFNATKTSHGVHIKDGSIVLSRVTKTGAEFSFDASKQYPLASIDQLGNLLIAIKEKEELENCMVGLSSENVFNTVKEYPIGLSLDEVA